MCLVRHRKRVDIGLGFILQNNTEPLLRRDINVHCRFCAFLVKIIIVHFKRLGSRCFYDLFERCYFFFLNRYAYSKTKPLAIWG